MKSMALLMMPKTGSTACLRFLWWAFASFGLQLGFHGNAPGLGDAPRRLFGRRRPDVVGAMRLGASDDHQRLDGLGLQGLDGWTARVSGVGQHPVRQADPALHGRDGGGKARRIGRVATRLVARISCAPSAQTTA